MKNTDYKNDMKRSLWVMLLWQTIIYAILWCISYGENALTNDGKILWKPIVITFYSISVLITFIIPMIKEYKNK